MNPPTTPAWLDANSLSSTGGEGWGEEATSQLPLRFMGNPLFHANPLTSHELARDIGVSVRELLSNL